MDRWEPRDRGDDNFESFDEYDGAEAESGRRGLIPVGPVLAGKLVAAPHRERNSTRRVVIKYVFCDA